jgi:nucleotide-binding universal stress UspA family protein
MEQTYRMVVGVDGSVAGQRALNWAVAEAARRQHAGQPCVVLAICAWQFEPLAEPESVAIRLPDPKVAAERLIDEAVTRACEDHPEVSVATEVLDGVPHDVLVRAGDQADLLVLGSHGHNHLYTAVVGSVTEGCIRNATCPVLVIPMAHGAPTTVSDKALARSDVSS